MVTRLYALHLTRDQIANSLALTKSNGVDFEVVKQMERLINNVNELVDAFPLTDVVEVDTNLAAQNVVLEVPVTQTGTYVVTFNWTMTGTGAGSWLLSPSNSGGFANTAFTYSLTAIETAGSSAFTAASTAPSYATSGDPLGVYSMTGTMPVTAIGTFGLTLSFVAGVSSTVHAGSRLVLQRVA